MHCEICQASAKGKIPLCVGCLADLPWNTHPCHSCGEPILPDHTLCTRCEKSPFPFSQVIIPFRYSFPLNDWISAFKYRELPGMTHWLAPLLSEQITCRQTKKPSLVLGVPMHPSQQRKRGYNQSVLLARHIAKLQGIEFSDTLLKKRHVTQHQRGLNAAARRHNLRDAFEVVENKEGVLRFWEMLKKNIGASVTRNTEEKTTVHLSKLKREPNEAYSKTTTRSVQGHDIALIDDVVTTGATSAEIAEHLLNAGASSVSLWALAKTPMQTPLPDSGSGGIFRR